MARSTYLGTANDVMLLVTRTTGAARVATSGGTLRFWADEAKTTQHTDLLLDGQPVTEVVIPAGVVIPPAVELPDGVNDGAWVEFIRPGETEDAPEFITPRFTAADVPTPTPASIGAETPTGAQAKVDEALLPVLADLADKVDTIDLDTLVGAELGTEGSDSKTVLDNRLAAERTFHSATFASKGQPASTQFAPPVGMAVTRQDSVYIYLCFSPDGSKIYARDTGSTGGRWLAVSTDNGATWTRKAAPDAVNGPVYGWTISTGALFVLCGPKLYRSTDDGATWTLPLTLETQEVVLNQGLVEATNGTLYAGVYSSGGAGAFYTNGAPVHQSTDGGVTWTLHSTFPSTMKGASGTSAIRHIHGMLAASDGSLWAATGDSAVESGIWKWEGGAWVRKTPLDTAGNGHRFCAVSLMERDGHLYWALDTNADDPGLMMKAPMSDLSAWVELADLPTSAYYSTALPDGTLLFGGSIEVGTGGFQDDTLRVWAVDPDDRVSLAWAAPLHKDGTGNRPVATLQAHPTNGTVLFWAKMLVDYRNPTAMYTGSYLATARTGLPTASTGNPVSRSGLWKASVTVSDKSTTSTTAVLLESVEVDTKGGPLLVVWSATVNHASANGVVYMGPSIDGTIAPQTGDIRRGVSGVAYQEFTLSGQAVIVPATPGKHTINLAWYGSAGTINATGIRRNLIVTELG